MLSVPCMHLVSCMCTIPDADGHGFLQGYQICRNSNSVHEKQDERISDAMLSCFCWSMQDLKLW